MFWLTYGRRPRLAFWLMALCTVKIVEQCMHDVLMYWSRLEGDWCWLSPGNKHWYLSYPNRVRINVYHPSCHPPYGSADTAALGLNVACTLEHLNRLAAVCSSQPAGARLSGVASAVPASRFMLWQRKSLCQQLILQGFTVSMHFGTVHRRWKSIPSDMGGFALGIDSRNILNLSHLITQDQPLCFTAGLAACVCPQ